MADEIDIANDRAMREAESGITAVQARLAGEGQSWCEDCGDDIPEARRKAVTNAIRCHPCQEVVDVKQGGYRRG